MAYLWNGIDCSASLALMAWARPLGVSSDSLVLTLEVQSVSESVNQSVRQSVSEQVSQPASQPSRQTTIHACASGTARGGKA